MRRGERAPLIMAGPGAEEADRFWQGQDHRRASARSRARADLALGLLRRASVEGGRLLDIGAGPGWALERFRQAGFEAEGLDRSPRAAEMARARGLEVRVFDVEAEQLHGAAGGAFEGAAEGGFRVVCALEVLEHLRDPLGVLAEMRRALSPGGVLVVSLPNELHLLRRLALLAGRPRWAGHRPFGGHDDPHLRFFTPPEAERLFAEAGLRILGRAWDGLAPPRRALHGSVLRGLSSALARLWPALFALSGIYLLAPRGEAPPTRGREGERC